MVKPSKSLARTPIQNIQTVLVDLVRKHCNVIIKSLETIGQPAGSD